MRHYLRVTSLTNQAICSMLVTLTLETGKRVGVPRDVARSYHEGLRPKEAAARLGLRRREVGRWYRELADLIATSTAQVVDKAFSSEPPYGRFNVLNVAAEMRVQSNRHKRRIGDLSEENSFTSYDWAEILDRYGGKCLACGTTENISIDHIVPLSKGGANTPDNLQPLCRSCNSAKGVRTIDFRPNLP